MTVTPSKRLIILILGITTHLNPGNILTASANQINNHSKDSFLLQPYFSNSNIVEPFQQYPLFFEKNLSFYNNLKQQMN